MVRKVLTLAGWLVVLIVMQTGFSFSVTPPNPVDEPPTIMYPPPGHPFEELICAPKCPGWVLITPLPSPGAPPSGAPSGASAPSPASTSGSTLDSFGPAAAAAGRINAPAEGAFMGFSTGAGHAADHASPQQIRGELKTVLKDLGL